MAYPIHFDMMMTIYVRFTMSIVVVAAMRDRDELLINITVTAEI